jgi:hypothetical protein
MKIKSSNLCKSNRPTMIYCGFNKIYYPKILKYMVNLIWLGCNFALIFLIVIRVSNKESGVQSFAISAPLSPQKTDESLTNFIWVLCLSFIILTGILNVSQNL